ncbi:Uncharacterised protein [Vibrio cholerae]|nr:Uncharacterised protein [Vibrio cholerae]
MLLVWLHINATLCQHHVITARSIVITKGASHTHIQLRCGFH